MPQESQGAIISKKQITALESDYYNEKRYCQIFREHKYVQKQKQVKLVSFKGLSPKALS